MANQNTVSRSTKLGPGGTRRGDRSPEDQGTRHPRRRRRHRRHRERPGRRHPRPATRHARGAGLGQRHLEPVVEARARRHPLPGAAGLPAGARGPHRARPAAAAPRPAPGEAGAVPLPAQHAVIERVYIGAGMLLYDIFSYTGGRPPGRAAPPAPDEAPGAASRCRACANDAFVGGITYYDAQVDDARYVASLARTASFYGAHVASRVRVEGFLKVGAARRRRAGTRPARPANASRSAPSRSSTRPASGPTTPRRMVGERGQFKVRASKGIHLRRAARPVPVARWGCCCAPRRACCSSSRGAGTG